MGDDMGTDNRKDLFQAAQAAALAQHENNVATFGTRFPDDTSKRQVYRERQHSGYWGGANVGWSTGYWNGMSWLAYELSGNPFFRSGAQQQNASFAQRLARRIDLNRHELGMLYGPSFVAAYRATGNPWYCGQVLQAARMLQVRFEPKAGFLQAWGRLDDERERGRIIIETVMNTPLLHWASSQSGDPAFADAASSHLLRTRELLVRRNGSIKQSCQLDAEGIHPPRYQSWQAQGEDTCWARGQAWAIYGFALNHRMAPGFGFLETAREMAEYLLARMPPHGICQWDLGLDWRSGQPQDSSASAIAVCGLLELAGQLGEAGARYRQAALDMLESLVRQCAAGAGHGKGLLAHGVYSLPQGRGVDESNLWGDYHYLEALARVNRDWTSFWLDGSRAVRPAPAADTPLWADYDFPDVLPRLRAAQPHFYCKDGVP
jgi:unsaturated chondroitin disaccharide hydrolase